MKVIAFLIEKRRMELTFPLESSPFLFLLPAWKCEQILWRVVHPSEEHVDQSCLLRIRVGSGRFLHPLRAPPERCLTLAVCYGLYVTPEE